MKMPRILYIISSVLCLQGISVATVDAEVPQGAIAVADKVLSDLKHKSDHAVSWLMETVSDPENVHLAAPYEACWFRGDDILKYLDGRSDNIKAYASECLYAFPLVTIDGQHLATFHVRRTGPEMQEHVDGDFYYSGGGGGFPLSSEFPEKGRPEWPEEKLMKRYYYSPQYTVSMISLRRIGVFLFVESNDGDWQGICQYGSATVLPPEYDDEGRFTWIPMAEAAPRLRRVIEGRRQTKIYDAKRLEDDGR